MFGPLGSDPALLLWGAVSDKSPGLRPWGTSLPPIHLGWSASVWFTSLDSECWHAGSNATLLLWGAV